MIAPWNIEIGFSFFSDLILLLVTFDFWLTITGSDTEVVEYRELDKEPRELISNVEIGETENQWPDQTDNQEVVQRFRIYSDTETDAFYLWCVCKI
jgi:hypothetical protein